MVTFEHGQYSVGQQLLGEQVWVRPRGAGTDEQSSSSTSALRARDDAEREFLAIGDGARVWLGEACAAGTQKIRAKMDAAVTMAKVAGNTRVDWSLGHAAVNGRFGHADLASILNAHPPTTTRRATESRSLAQGTVAGPASAPRPTRQPPTRRPPRR